jgi:soluble lytic murein transglycosylase
VSRAHPLAPHRVALAVVVLLLGLVALLAVRGPAWYQRLYHPLHYQTAITEASKESGVDPYLLAAVINVESGHRSGRVSQRGAVGLMQLLPSTARETAARHHIPVADETTAALAEPRTNIRIGAEYLRGLVNRYKSIPVALAAYNAGATHAEAWRAAARKSGKPFLDEIGYPQTRRYVQQVVSQRDTYARLYPDAFSKEAKP